MNTAPWLPEHPLARPALRYHGGKWRIAPWIISHFPQHSLYCEPFGGGASVLLRKKPSTQEVYNDLDAEIVNVFRVLQRPEQAEELRRLLTCTPYARAEYELSYEASDSPVESARRTIIRSFMGHTSNAVTSRYRNGFRHRRNDAPGPSLEWTRYPDHVSSFVTRLRGVVLECLPAMRLIPRYDTRSTLFYVDPPYLLSTRTAHTCSYRHEMSDEDHVALAEMLHSVSGMVVLSGYDSPLYRELYADWNIVTKNVHSNEKCACGRCRATYGMPVAVVGAYCKAVILAAWMMLYEHRFRPTHNALTADAHIHTGDGGREHYLPAGA
jgi:DNA adenine methylase